MNKEELRSVQINLSLDWLVKHGLVNNEGDEYRLSAHCRSLLKHFKEDGNNMIGSCMLTVIEASGTRGLQESDIKMYTNSLHAFVELDKE